MSSYGRAPWSPIATYWWRNMLHQCQYREHDWPALTMPPRVVVLDRPLGQGRTMRNRAAVVEHVWRRYGGDVEVVGSTLEVCNAVTLHAAQPFTKSLARIFLLVCHASPTTPSRALACQRSLTC